MQADRHPVPAGSLVDRPPVAPAVGQIVHRRQQDLDEPRVAGPSLDLLDGECRILRRHHDRGKETAVPVQPGIGEPVVDRATQGCP